MGASHGCRSDQAYSGRGRLQHDDRITHNVLKQLGFEQVDDANDGSTALAKLRRRDYGLVISDWNMGR